MSRPGLLAKPAGNSPAWMLGKDLSSSAGDSEEDIPRIKEEREQDPGRNLNKPRSAIISEKIGKKLRKKLFMVEIFCVLSRLDGEDARFWQGGLQIKGLSAENIEMNGSFAGQLHF
jgi:hypothetical protein